MALAIRLPRPDELQIAQELVVRSINDLTQRHGFGPIASVRSPDFQLFFLRHDPDGLWLAEDDGEIIGFAFSWVSGEFWFLAELFVSPGHQGRGIGNKLLARTLDHARKAGARNKALITFTFNVVSQGLYIRHGMFPRLPIYFFSVDRSALMSCFQGENVRCMDIENTDLHLRAVTEIDAATLGITREMQHRYLLTDASVRGYFLYAGKDCVGYAYISSTGHIGPIAVLQLTEMGRVFTTALSLAAQGGASQVSGFLPGANDTALSIACKHGMRIIFPMVLVSSRDFGDWTRYLPRNPGFM